MQTIHPRTSILPALALAGLVSVTLLQATAPAAAVQMSACQIRHSQCTERCIMNSSGPRSFEQAGACIRRTCDKQSPGCGPGSLPGGTSNRPGTNAGTTPGYANIPPKPKLGLPGGGGVFTPSAGGLLEDAPVLGSQGPAATGAPMAPTPGSAPHIIR